MSQTQPALSRVEIRKIMKRHKGAVMEVARRIHVTHPVVSAWLRGRATSKRVAAAAAEYAAELLEREQDAAA